MSLPDKKKSPSRRIVSSAAPFAKRLHWRGIRSSGKQGTIFNPLLNIPIGTRLTLGFFIPALIAAIILSSVGTQNQERLTQEATFSRHLLNAYTSLTEETSSMQEMQTDLSQAANYAAQPHPILAILQDDQVTIRGLAIDINTTFVTYYKQDLIKDSPDLVALFTEAGHGTQIEEQLTYSEGILQSWQAYRSIQEQVLGMLITRPSKAPGTIIVGHLTAAQTLIFTQANVAFTDAMRDLQVLANFNGSLGKSLEDAANVEMHRFFDSTILAGLGILLGIGLMGWLISNTLVQRLKKLRSVVQSIEKGQFDARVAVVGRDEISAVSAGVNAMLDTIINAHELERLHQELQSQHEALNTAHAHLNEANARLEALATTDALTGLPNHRSLASILDQELERAQRYYRSCPILFLDIDHFKALNDGFGHVSGDTILQEFSTLIRTRLRGIDTVGRWGGEEFVVVLPEMTLDEAYIFAEEIRVNVAANLFNVGGGTRLTCSIGIACYPANGSGREELMNAADQTMYAAKRLGRNQVRRADDPLVLALLLEKNQEGGREKTAMAGVVEALLKLVEAHDPSTSLHSLKVSDLLTSLTQHLGIPALEAQMIALAGRLHDIGKISIPDSILHKPGELTEEEWEIIRTHSATGAEVVSNVPVLRPLAPMIRAHHERWDGQGYPDHLAGGDIPYGARIIAVVNAYMAMTVDRPYQKARSQAEALVELKRCANTQFDPQIVEAMEYLLLFEQKAEIAGVT